MISIGENIKRLPKKDLKKWIAEREKNTDSPDWKDELAKLKKRLDVKGTGTKSEDN